MAPKSPTPKSNDLFRQRLDELVNLRHPLAQLAGHIDWSVFEHEWAGLFPSRRGRPATAPRLIAGLLYLQHTYALSDEDVVWGWVENPYWQLFCGETWFQHHPPIDPSSLTRWRKRIGEEGLEWLLTQTIRAAQSVGAEGDAFHALLCGCGHNLRLILKKLRLLWAWILDWFYRQLDGIQTAMPDKTGLAA